MIIFQSGLVSACYLLIDKTGYDIIIHMFTLTYKAQTEFDERKCNKHKHLWQWTLHKCECLLKLIQRIGPTSNWTDFKDFGCFIVNFSHVWA